MNHKTDRKQLTEPSDDPMSYSDKRISVSLGLSELTAMFALI